MNEAGVLPRVDVTALLGYLTRIGVVDAAAAAVPGVRVTDLSRSHLVLSVRFGDGRHLVVKRARARPGEVAGDLGREVLAYRLAGSNRALSDAMPAPLWLDPAARVLVTEAVEPGTTLYADAVRNGPPPVDRARELGRVVGTWHRGTTSLSRAGLPAEAPWVLGILTAGRWRPPEADRVLVHGEVRRELRTAFADLTAALVPSCLVHGDLKWDNCLIDARGGIRVVDWEHVAHGDPAWDVAGILQDYVAVRRTLGDHPGRAESIAAFMTAYLDFVEPAQRQRFAERAARLTGARLVQTALEYAATGVDLLGDALRILREPRTLLAAGSTW